VLAFDFFFTEPYFQFTIASATDFWAAVLLLIVAAIVSAVAAQAQHRAETARRAAQQATALQVLAHTVIDGRPQRETQQAAGLALGQLFGAPSSIFREAAGGVELVATSAGASVTAADEEAALGAVTLQLPLRARSYPFEKSHFDFWPVQTSSAGMFVLGVDFSRAADGRPAHPERLVETVGGYLAAAGAGR
jgi:two-component system sensor histidine kinase KdpD